MKIQITNWLLCLQCLSFAFSINAVDDSASEISDESSPIDLEKLGQQVLNDVLKFHLRTANSIASSFEDRASLERMRQEIPCPVVGNSDGFFSVSIDGLYGMAKKSIEYGLAHCDEYSAITTILLKKYESLYPNQIKVSLQRGANFSHIVAVIFRPRDLIDKWIAVDPWLRKIIPFLDIDIYLSKALVTVSENKKYKFQRVEILEKYDLNNHDLEHIIYNDNRDYLSLPRDLSGTLNTIGYLVPYDGYNKGHYVSYDPENHLDPLANQPDTLSVDANVLDEEGSVYDSLGYFIKHNEEFNFSIFVVPARPDNQEPDEPAAKRLKLDNNA
jgi:hypothetical protein